MRNTNPFNLKVLTENLKDYLNTDEFYERVCEADFHYCPRVRRMVEDNPSDYEKIKNIISMARIHVPLKAITWPTG